MTFNTQSKEAVISATVNGITLFDEMQLEDINIRVEWTENEALSNPFDLNRLKITLNATIMPFSNRIEVNCLMLTTVANTFITKPEL